MAVHIALLRGINVGGNKPIRMEALRALCQSIGFTDARTLLQSGNVVFRADAGGPDKLARTLETAIAAEFGFAVTVLVRRPAELADVIRRNPFPQEAADAPGRLVVMFLDAAPGKAAIDRLTGALAGPEIVTLAGREAFIVYPDGIGRSKLTNVAIEKLLGVAGTARNWNTVTRLDALAETLATS
jgi:uncharacterized protein (DUF1697 family)